MEVSNAVGSNEASIVRTQHSVGGHRFFLEARYVPRKVIGKGAYGVVCLALDNEKSSRKIAIKRVKPIADAWDITHCMREIDILHRLYFIPSVIAMYDLDIQDVDGERFMNIVMEYMDCDLHKILRSPQTLTMTHVKYLMRQLVEGVSEMHRMGMLHRDLKPANLLVSSSCDLRITDFGLARQVKDVRNDHLDEDNKQGNEGPLTEYVVTRWYRCPELLLMPQPPEKGALKPRPVVTYGPAIDVWSMGCILAEMILRNKGLFEGSSYLNQIQLIFACLGWTPAVSLTSQMSTSSDGSKLQSKTPRSGRSNLLTLNRMKQELGIKSMQKLPPLQSSRSATPSDIDQFSNLGFIVDDTDANALDIISKMLILNPSHRITAMDCLTHPFLNETRCSGNNDNGSNCDSCKHFRPIFGSADQDDRTSNADNGQNNSKVDILLASLRNKVSQVRREFRADSNQAVTCGGHHPQCPTLDRSPPPAEVVQPAQAMNYSQSQDQLCVTERSPTKMMRRIGKLQRLTYDGAASKEIIASKSRIT